MTDTTYEKSKFVDRMEAILKVYNAFFQAVPQMAETIRRFDSKIINARFEKAMRAVLLTEAGGKRAITRCQLEESWLVGNRRNYCLVFGTYEASVSFQFSIDEGSDGKFRLNADKAVKCLEEEEARVRRYAAEIEESIVRYDEFSNRTDKVCQAIRDAYADCPDSLWYHFMDKAFNDGSLYGFHKPRN